ncbi:bifunctional tetrahydrofolate synthase/dihydrofolate synthase [Seongchinamella unica]|uniref:Dihydrofolate synthase/folylpolyglutamate synthase n=1 Tax=Seongchinamella unica TaxID=2547392 RepID=A0A4R5LSJ9_9GAMM|nr:bifunctional tetrahydrofolate synthase/dihydrofolate synthase [Seongchinamella unica]TDG13707.1 bifunctional tetrahydrofolate synthase/dihydrofolate synthase [Seongchinamella unica]
MNKRPLAQWLQYLETLHPSEMDLGLERVSLVADSLALRPPAVPVVTVAGTNGKGSTVAVMEALLTVCGYRVGAFTSPHFLRFNERIRVCGEEVSDGEISAAFAAIEAARGNTSLTYFEFANLAALAVFKARAVDYILLEVGLGGRLDSANMVDADVAVITSIALDHQQWLGDTRAAIAREKAGIMREGKPVVIADVDPPPELLARAQEVGAQPVYVLGNEFTGSGSGALWRGSISGATGIVELDGMQTPSLLPQNVCAAAQAVALLGMEFSQQQLQQAAQRSVSPGRLQRLQIGDRCYLLDVAHNPAAVDKLLENIAATPCNGRIIALFSAMKDKAVAEMLAACSGCFDAWFLGDLPDNPRAMPAAQIATLLREQQQGMISVSKNLRQAFRRAQSLMNRDDLLVVFGSFFTVAAVLPQLDKDRGKIGADE